LLREGIDRPGIPFLLAGTQPASVVLPALLITEQDLIGVLWTKLLLGWRFRHAKRQPGGFEQDSIGKLRND
jgi:hypothetical protein